MLMFGDNKPEPTTFVYDLGRKQYTINFDCEETDGQYSWKSATLEPGYWSYGTIVSAIITLKYTDSQIEAINNNMMAVLSGTSDASEEKQAEYKQEFAELQSWRNHAKEIASEAMNSIE